MRLPARIGDFTDFFAGIHHARTAGTINRPENPLMPNYKYVPVAYHSRASSVRPSSGTVRRPNGQRKPPDQATPDFGPCRSLDYELELGVWIGAGNELGTPIPIAEASASHCRLLPAERLVRARHPKLGDAASGTVPVKKRRDVRLALGHHA